MEKFECIVRGDGKGYALLKNDSLFETAMEQGKPDAASEKQLFLKVFASDASVQGEIAPFQSKRGDLKGVVLVFPLLQKDFSIALLQKDVSGSVDTIGEWSVNPTKLKWVSRLNYRLKKDLAHQIRDTEHRNLLTHQTIHVDEAIATEDGDIARGTIVVPGKACENASVKVYDRNLVPQSIEVIPLGASSCANRFDSKNSLTRLGFSIKFPGECAGYLLVPDSALDPAVHASFCYVDKKMRDCMVKDFELRTQNAEVQDNYEDWLESHARTEEDLFLQSIADFEYEPVISIVVPVYNTPIVLFDEMASSVLSQTYSHWELLLVNASPENTELSGRMAECASADERIRILDVPENLGITKNTDIGIQAAKGDYVAFLDHDDFLAPDALFEYVSAINQDPSIELLYCDEDKIKDGVRFDPYFKPDLSLFLMREVNYICHFLMVKRSLLQQISHDDSLYDGAQDHNMILQCLEKTQNVKHIPRVLYTWRITEGSTAGGTDAKPYANTAGRLAIEAHLKRMGVAASVEDTCDNCRYHVRYAVVGNPLVSILIPNKDNAEILGNCIDSILDKTGYQNFEVVVIENNSQDKATFDFYEVLKRRDSRIKVITWEEGFNFSAINNFGVKEAKGEYLLFLNNDTEVLSSNWLETMLGICQQPGVGAVGAKLLYPDMLIQHAGVYVQGEGAGHLALNLPRHARGYFSTVRTTHELSAVTAACMMADRKVFEQVGGFDPEYAVAFNDVDLCMKIRAAGYSIIYSPLVELVHYESISRGYEDTPEKTLRFNKEAALLRWKWSDQYALGDPYINRNLHNDCPYYVLG